MMTVATMTMTKEANTPQIFNFKGFDVRVLMVSGDALFVLVDVCNVGVDPQKRSLSKVRGFGLLPGAIGTSSREWR